MRTGRSIMALQGHVQGILTMDFSPDGYHLATGSEDHSCRIWDLRKRGCVYTLPAHKSLIAQVLLGQPVVHSSAYCGMLLLLSFLQYRCVICCPTVRNRLDELVSVMIIPQKQLYRASPCVLFVTSGRVMCALQCTHDVLCDGVKAFAPCRYGSTPTMGITC